MRARDSGSGPVSPDPETPEPPRPLLLDACCFINLFASRRIEEIAGDLPFLFSVVDIARREVSFVRRGGRGDDAQDPEPVDWASLLGPGLVRELQLEGEAEEADFVDLAQLLDEGEAATLAVAINRTLAVATDDRKARNILSSRAPSLPLRSTLELLQQWCHLRALSEREVAELLKNVRERGRFLPPRGDPLIPWWTKHFGSAT